MYLERQTIKTSQLERQFHCKIRLRVLFPNLLFQMSLSIANIKLGGWENKEI